MRPRTLLFVAVTSVIAVGAATSLGGLRALFSTDYLPHSFCYLAQPALIWTNVLADLLIAAAYVALFVALVWAVTDLKRIAELRRYLWVFASFGGFILACGATHMMEVVTIWWPAYRLSAAIKIVCALISIPTAVIFVWNVRTLTRGIHELFVLLATRQEQAEALRVSQEFLDRTGIIAGIGGWAVDLASNKVAWSTQTYRIHRAPLDYVPTVEQGISFYVPEARSTILSAVEAASAGGPGWDLELPIIRMDGERIMVRCAGEVEYCDGKAVRLLGAFQDITSEVAARNELRLANERLTLATDGGEIGIWDFDIPTQTLNCSPWMFRLHDKDPDSPPEPGELWRDHVHPDDRAAVDQALQRAIDGVEDYDTEFRVIWRDGSVHTIRATAGVSRDEAGSPIRLAGANWDVTEARRMAAELVGQHDLLKVTLQSIGDGVITKDANRVVLWMNTVAERMTGWSAAEAIGRPVDDIFQALDEITRKPIKKVFTDLSDRSSTTSTTQLALLISLDGKERLIETSGTPIWAGDGNLHGNILVFRDVTKQRRAAAETEQINKLQLELKTKDEFLSHVSHELRSPLTSIYSFVSIIADDLAGPTNPEQKEYLQIVLKNVVQLQSMIEDLLTVTQSREGKLSIELQEVSVASAVRDAINTLRSAASTKQITLSADDTSDLPPVCADPIRLRQIFIILLDNAIKFTPEGGKVSISVTKTHQDRLLFRIRDTGCGIPEEKREAVFQNLYQITGPAAPDTSQQGRIGLGLGLHIARSLVTRQSGDIWITGAPDGGSIFNIVLPVYTEGCLAADSESDRHRRRKTDRPLEDRAILDFVA